MIRNVAIIPARGGSKRIPGKNIRPFLGKPIIAYSIEAAINSDLFDHIIVSTDSEKIANVSIEFGAEVPFLRPSELSDDFTGTAAVVDHALRWLMSQRGEVQNVCCLYPTAPFITLIGLHTGYQTLIDSKADVAFPVVEHPSSIFRSLKINATGKLEMFWPENRLVRTQDLTKAYFDAGQYYWLDAKAFLKNGSLYGKQASPIIVSESHIHDIDNETDWEMAEIKFRLLIGKNLKQHDL